MQQRSLENIIKKCDIYFDGSLISKERIIKKYAEFLVSSFNHKDRIVGITLHTGSMCFDIISFLTVALECLALDNTKSEDIVGLLEVGDKVLYGEKKQERYIWRGFADKDCTPILQASQTDKGFYAVLEQPSSGIIYTPQTRWHLITPYYGDAQATDGRGLRRRTNNRADFLSDIFNISPTQIPGITGVSAVIVTERNVFKRIVDGLTITYDKGNSIALLDIVTASYFTDNGEEYQYGGNPGKNEPVLKITGKISTARDLVLNKRGNQAVGLMVMGSAGMIRIGSELSDLLSRKSLHFTHLSMNMDLEDTEKIIDLCGESSVFACTKEFLLQNSLPIQQKNTLTKELDRQIENIINNNVSPVIVDGNCSWEEYRKVKESLFIIRKSEWDNEEKDKFIINAHALLNLFMSAVFPIGILEETIKKGKLISGIISPLVRIQNLWRIAESAGAVVEHCIYVADLLDKLYKANLSECPKYNVLKQQLNASAERKIAVVVPKAYYIDILYDDELINNNYITVVTANRFNNIEQFDEIIAVGDFTGKRFDPLKCYAAIEISVLLYECETHSFRLRRDKNRNFERKLNSKTGIIEEVFEDDAENAIVAYAPNYEVEMCAEQSLDLEQYIGRLSTFDIKKYAVTTSDSVDSAQTSEVCIAGRFIGGEQILFSKYYEAVVFNAAKGIVEEIKADNLAAGDMIVFARRDGYTQNMVDYIYESLQTSGKLNNEIIEATEKSLYWKEALREYMTINHLSYRGIADELRVFGSTLQEGTIRQWLHEESHIVGPRDERTFKQIAELTKDKFLLEDTHEYFEACRTVRYQRKEILKLIGKAIVDKLSGNKPMKSSMFEVVYNNVENLSETFELESITVLEEPIAVPVNIINKPIMEWEELT